MASSNGGAPVATTGLRFDDEFNSFMSSTDGSTGTWMTTYPYGGEAAYTLTSNGEGEYYGQANAANSPFSLANGVLDISAGKAAPGSNPYGLPYTSGLITTHGSYAQTYGYFEARVEMPAGQGLWPAFWMLPVSVHDATELDVFEMLGNNPSTFYSTTHGYNGAGVGQNFTVPDTSTGFHTYGVDWEPDTVTFYMDGAKLGATPTPASMNQPMYMLLNLAVGGTSSWPGAPSATTPFPATMQVDYVRAYATANTTYSAGSAALPVGAPPPVLPPLPTAPPAPVVLGSGPDVLALLVSEDAWQGDAQYTVSIDGQQVGGVQSAAAAHAAGAVQTVNVLGSFGQGTHTATVNFLNDAWGGTAATDRNLYVTGASMDGAAVAGTSLAEMGDGPQSFAFQGGADTLVLGVSEDAWQGDAQYTVTVDGKQVGGTYTATASHAAGQVGQQVIAGSWGRGAHTVGVTFVNDAWGGNAAMDRNLYVNAASYDGTAVAMGTLTQNANGTMTIAAPPVGSDSLVLGVSEDAWNGDAQYTVSVDGKQAGGTYTATASHSAGQVNQQAISGSWGKGPHTVGITFINDAWGGSAAMDRNLFVNTVSYDGTPVAMSPLAQYSGGTATVATPAVPGLLTLHMAEDAYQGDAQFTVAIDGKQMGAVQSVTASYATGATQDFKFAVQGTGAHDVAVSFLNDAWGGLPALDRNLHVAGADLNGTALGSAAWTAELLTTSTTHFNLVVPS